MHANAVFSSSSRSADPLVLVAEISHRVVNEYAQAIAGIRLAARNIASREAQAVLATAATRLLNFAEAHRALQAPRSGDPVDLATYVETLCGAMAASCLQERGVHLVLAADPVILPAERCWRVGLILAELITNGLRHGLKDQAGRIRVEIDVGPDIACRVIDDGAGALTPKPGRGFTVVTGLADELGGSMAWRFTPQGTTAELSFPNPNRERAA